MCVVLHLLLVVFCGKNEHSLTYNLQWHGNSKPVWWKHVLFLLSVNFFSSLLCGCGFLAALLDWCSFAALFQTPLLSTLPGSGPIGFSPSVRPINLSPQPLPVMSPMGPSPPSNNHSSPSGTKEGPTALCAMSPGQSQVRLVPVLHVRTVDWMMNCPLHIWMS